MTRIAVDMTPLRPGGENGGAKVLTLELLKAFRQLAPHDRFILLTAAWNHAELAMLDAPNLERHRVLTGPPPPVPGLYGSDARRNPSVLLRGARKLLRPMRNLRRFRPRLRNLDAELLFCPFSSLTYAEGDLPVVVVLHDLQHRDYPSFFHPGERALRDDFMNRIRVRANAVICVSDYTRQSFIRHFKADPEKCRTVPNCIQSRLHKLPPETLQKTTRRLGLSRRPYMFYPANFWPHKNHALLLAAYHQFRQQNPQERLDLVFTGALEEGEKKLRGDVAQLDLSEHVHFMGFLPEADLAAVWQGCEFLIFPSLYEGFGIPVLESMQFEKPVLCSNTTSLPEVAGDAALYFDPSNPEEIAGCIEQFINHPEIGKDLVRRGRRRVRQFQTGDMARRYLGILHSTAQTTSPRPNETLD